MAEAKFPGLKLHYARVGEGAPVVFIQGVGIPGRAWAPQVERLMDSFECVVFDNRGVGESAGELEGMTVGTMVDDLRLLLDHLGLARVHLVGHSLGGVIATDFAIQFPDRVHSLALFCTFARGSDALTPSLRMMYHGLATRIGTAVMRRRAFARMVMPQSYLDARGVDQVADELSDLFGRPLEQPPLAASKQLRALSKHHSIERLHELSHLPSLVVSGRDDPIAPPEYGRMLAEAIGTRRFLEIANASHALTIQYPRETSDELKKHLEQSTPVSTLP